MPQITIPCDPGQVSDGYHTFDELYEHRCLLFISLMKSHPQISWISQKHHDGSEWDGWFIAGMDLPPSGNSITYHLPAKLWDLAVAAGAFVTERGREWDGHTSADVCKRITEWLSAS